MPQPNNVIVIINTLGSPGSPALRRWLAKGTLTRMNKPSGLLDRLLDLLGARHAGDGQAALRFLGQTGDKPAGWIAAADPIYLEPRLDHLCLHTLSDTMRDGELAHLMEHLNESLGGAAGFRALGSFGYLESQPMPAADVEPDALHGYVPNKFLPAGPEASAYRRQQSEIEMALHDHPVNLKRQADGLQPVNSLWVWGAGQIPAATSMELPPLFADDPLLRGFWISNGAEIYSWTGSLASTFDQGGVVAVPEADSLAAEERLEGVRAAFTGNAAGTLHILTRDGSCFRIRRADRWKFWRRESDVGGAAV